MKRSEINLLLKDAVRFFEEHQFRLPPWAFWSLGQWKSNKADAFSIKELRLGWDLTDFGSGDFYRRGLLLFCLRNGRPDGSGKNYAEKIMIVREEQETPLHFHWSKTEDIINRGGGNLVMELYNAAKNDEKTDDPVQVDIDHISRTFKAGEPFALRPGEGICLKPRIYHRFYGEKGKGKVLVGEVSNVNDDTKDNRFYEPLGRFPAIEEDEPPLYPLCMEYP